KAFDLIVSKYQIRIYKIILKYIDNGSEALDVMQEAFLKAYQAMEFFRGESSLYTWLYRIAVNTAKNYTISNSKNSKTQSLDDEMDFSIKKSNPKDSASPENLLARDELEKILFEAIETLPQELKTAILLRELGGKSYEDISVIMDCPVGTVRSRIFRARETIEQGISPFLNLQ
ncbi:MAG: sigma-70 family RNA polymerase sigma factor, partial [Gammaproteobacteria bacterium]